MRETRASPAQRDELGAISDVWQLTEAASHVALYDEIYKIYANTSVQGDSNFPFLRTEITLPPLAAAGPVLTDICLSACGHNK